MPQLDLLTFCDQSILILFFFWSIYFISRRKILPQIRVMLFLRKFFFYCIKLDFCIKKNSFFFIQKSLVLIKNLKIKLNLSELLNLETLFLNSLKCFIYLYNRKVFFFNLTLKNLILNFYSYLLLKKAFLID